MIRRREFITLLGGAAAWPLAARAQQSAKVSRLGVLLLSTPQADPQMETARRALHDLGYVEGHNLSIEYRYAGGRPERLPDLAADLVRTKPDVLFALGGDVTPAAVKATHTIPIVFTSSADPVRLGFVAKSRPTGRQCHRRHLSAGRTRVQAARDFQTGGPSHFACGLPVESGSPRQ